MLSIVVDYDNDAIRLQSEDDTVLWTFRKPFTLSRIEDIISETLNAAGYDVALRRQSEGTVTTVSEWE
jgi:hypothetical protein